MKTLIPFLFAICLSVSLSNEAFAQATTAGNTPAAGTDYLGWNNGATQPLTIKCEANQPINFHTNTGAGGAGNIRMTILGGGNVGIGSTPPTNFISAPPFQYSTGTASQSSDIITGTGTTFTIDMVGSQFVFANGTSAGTITEFFSSTSLEVSTAQTVANQAYTISYTGFQLTSTGRVGIGTTTPNQLLHVIGNVNIASDNTYRIADRIVLGDKSSTSTPRNIFLGNEAGENLQSGGTLMDSQGNTCVGARAGRVMADGAIFNTLIGSNSGQTLTTGDYNTTVGNLSGQAITTGEYNTALGANAGFSLTTGVRNTFIGSSAGYGCQTGNYNVCIGDVAGRNVTASENVFVGYGSGNSNTSGTYNVYLGTGAGHLNTTSSENVFVGRNTGYNITGASNERNTFLGALCGNGGSLTDGDNVTLIGYNAEATNDLTNATAIGANAKVEASNALILGSINGTNGASANTNVGIGISIPVQRLHVEGTARIKDSDGTATTVMGRDGDGDISSLGLGTGFSITGGTLNYSVGTGGGWLLTGNGGTTAGTNFIGTTDAIDWVVKTNGTERVRVIGGATNTGNVGIHTTTPTAKLHAVEDAAVNDNLAVYGYSSTASVTNKGVKGEAYGTGTTRNVGAEGKASGSTSGSNIGVWGYATLAEQNYGGQFSATSGTGATDNFGVYAEAGNASTTNYAAYFGGNGYLSVSSWTYGSDQAIKENIQPLTDNLSIINQLQPKKYQFKTADFPFLRLAEGEHYGLIAQEVELILPNLIGVVNHPTQFDSVGNEISPAMTFRGLKYTELIPFLIGAIKEQQLQIEDLNSRLNSCCGPGIQEFQVPDNGYNQPSTINHQQLASVARDLPVLSQNQPNPFSEKTVIRFYIPKTTKDAAIKVFDNTGSVYRLFSITGEGPGTIELEANSLAAGSYYYSLLIGGNVIDTKLMVITK